jgi:hypothetical protein
MILVASDGREDKEMRGLGVVKERWAEGLTGRGGGRSLNGTAFCKDDTDAIGVRGQIFIFIII